MIWPIWFGPNHTLANPHSHIAYERAESAFKLPQSRDHTERYEILDFARGNRSLTVAVLKTHSEERVKRPTSGRPSILYDLEKEEAVSLMDLFRKTALLATPLLALSAASAQTITATLLGTAGP